MSRRVGGVLNKWGDLRAGSSSYYLVPCLGLRKISDFPALVYSPLIWQHCEGSRMRVLRFGCLSHHDSGVGHSKRRWPQWGKISALRRIPQHRMPELALTTVTGVPQRDWGEATWPGSSLRVAEPQANIPGPPAMEWILEASIAPATRLWNIVSEINRLWPTHIQGPAWGLGPFPPLPPSHVHATPLFIHQQSLGRGGRVRRTPAKWWKLF